MKETEQTLLDQIKDEVANKLCGIPDFNDLVKKYTRNRKLVPLNVMNEVCERYATAKAQASCEATLKNAADNAKWGRQDGTNKRAIVKSSITNPSNITIV